VQETSDEIHALRDTRNLLEGMRYRSTIEIEILWVSYEKSEYKYTSGHRHLTQAFV
jgi:hypothetical protein